MFLVAHHVWLCPASMYWAPELPCIINSIRVAPPALGYAGFTSGCLLHMNQDQLDHLSDNQQDGSVSHHWTGVRVPVEFINWQCCTLGKSPRGGSYLALYDQDTTLSARPLNHANNSCHHQIEGNLLTYNRRPLVCYHHCCIYLLCLSFFSAPPASSRHTMQAALMGPNSC